MEDTKCQLSLHCRSSDGVPITS